MGNVHIFSGDDEFAVKEAARNFVASVCGGDPAACDFLETVPGGGSRFEEVAGPFLSALRTPPFLTDRQVIWLRDFQFFEQLLAANTPPAAAIIDHLTGAVLPEQTVVIDGPGFDQRKSAAKKLKAAVELQIFSRAKSTDRNYSGDRQQLIRRRCSEAGKELTPDAAAYLAETIGGDTGVLFNELDKLITYAGNNPRITLADCQAICVGTPEAVSWAFTGALTSRDLKGALRLLGRLLDQGSVEVQLMASIGNEFQNLAQVKSAMRELNLPERLHPRIFDTIPEAVRSAHPDNPLLKLHPFRAFKMCESASGFSDASLATALKAAAEATRILVSGGGDPRITLEQLIYRICRA